MTTLTTQKNGIIRAQRPRISRWQRIVDLLSVLRQRRALADLDDHLLRDIGIDRHHALAEARKSVWDVPAHWCD